eukprot:Skav231402  [mRNA]  locus=scaffold4039:6476:9147:+ [translate_table: standard]
MLLPEAMRCATYEPMRFIRHCSSFTEGSGSVAPVVSALWCEPRGQACPVLVDAKQRSAADLAAEVGASQLARQLRSYADEWQSASLRLQPRSAEDGRRMGGAQGEEEAPAGGAHKIQPQGAKCGTAIRVGEEVQETQVVGCSVDPPMDSTAGPSPVMCEMELVEAAGANPEWNESFEFFVQGTEAPAVQSQARASQGSSSGDHSLHLGPRHHRRRGPAD